MSNNKHAYSGDFIAKQLNKLRQILKNLDKYVEFGQYMSDPFEYAIFILKLILSSGEIQSSDLKDEITLLHETLSVHSYFRSKNETLTNLCDIPVLGLLQLSFQSANGDIPYVSSSSSSSTPDIDDLITRVTGLAEQEGQRAHQNVLDQESSSTSSSSTPSSLTTPSSNYGLNEISNEEKARRIVSQLRTHSLEVSQEQKHHLQNLEQRISSMENFVVYLLENNIGCNGTNFSISIHVKQYLSDAMYGKTSIRSLNVKLTEVKPESADISIHASTFKKNLEIVLNYLDTKFCKFVIQDCFGQKYFNAATKKATSHSSLTQLLNAITSVLDTTAKVTQSGASLDFTKNSLDIYHKDGSLKTRLDHYVQLYEESETKLYAMEARMNAANASNKSASSNAYNDIPYAIKVYRTILEANAQAHILKCHKDRPGASKLCAEYNSQERYSSGITPVEPLPHESFLQLCKRHEQKVDSQESKAFEKILKDSTKEIKQLSVNLAYNNKNDSKSPSETDLAQIRRNISSILSSENDLQHKVWINNDKETESLLEILTSNKKISDEKLAINALKNLFNRALKLSNKSKTSKGKSSNKGSRKRFRKANNKKFEKRSRPDHENSL
jgi:hypothetical protein